MRGPKNKPRAHLSGEQAVQNGHARPTTALQQRVLAMCEVSCDCWVWKGFAISGSQPSINMGKSGGQGLVRRFLLREKLGRDIEPGKYAGRTCETTLCVNPAHIKETSRSEQQMLVAARKPAAAHCSAKRRDATRQACGTLDLEKARAIRASDESTEVLMARYGVTATTIKNVRNGKTWVEVTPLDLAALWR